ncbi:YraN family protein [Caldanaerobius polysaccharolyticus]|uniref:YraN family protein n=1 Tax=Caldanaerobius polysaccharolyticus TaxID=44256 RepID=UPI000479714E|nr:YraN family protein [Caldanaerobius polysaccharolyticus]
MNNREIGCLGERIAESYLVQMGYTILERNFRQRGGEIDIVAQDDGTICFIEVKTRTGDAFGAPSEAVDIRKRAKISHMAMAYLYKNKLHNRPCRFDVVEIWLSGQSGEVKRINLIKDAFDFV